MTDGTVTPARAAALEALSSVHGGMGADEALDAAFAGRPGISAADRALAMELAYGVLRWRRRLDGVLERHCRKGLPCPPLLDVLRLGAYGLLFLDVPPHATVSTAVEAARATKGKEAAARFANAVLRAVAAEAGERRAEAPPERGRRALAAWYSFPNWMVEGFAEITGADALAPLLAASNARPPLSLRARPGERAALLDALAAAGLPAAAGRFAPDAVLVPSPRGRVEDLPGFREGRFAVQDEGAQLVTGLLGEIGGKVVLDACAAPGGKAIHAAQLGAKVTAVDASASRLERVRAAARRLGAEGMEAVAAKVGREGIAPLGGRTFHAVLVDAPCSATGIVRRKPDAKWARDRDEVVRLAARQGAILEGASRHLAPGGRLVYAVCSLLRAEGEGVVEPFLAAHPELEVVAPPPVFASGRFFRCRPDVHGTDGFFAAILERRA